MIRAATTPLATLVACWAALWIGLGSPELGAAELERGDLRLELGAELRTLFTLTRQPHTDAVFPGGSTHGRDTATLLERARISLEGSWADRVSGEFVYDNEWRTGTGLDALSFAIGRELGSGTWLDAERTISDHEDLFWRHLLYRGWLRYEAERFELTLGRQRIALGRGRLWNPTDLFNPIPALAVEGDQRIGQDAAVARFALSPALWAVAIWSPQDDPDDHRIAARLELSRTEIDAAVIVARIRRDYVFGADFATNLGDAALRGEATFTDLQGGGRVWQVVGSLDYTFSIGTGLYALVEHFYNEALVPRFSLGVVPPGIPAQVGIAQLLASAAAFDELQSGRLVSTARNRTGASAGYDLTPLLRMDVLWIHDWNGSSEAFVPTLRWSIRDDLDFAVGAQLFWGQHADSEYGDVPNLFFVQLDAWF